MTKLFTREHEWIELADDEATIGITHHAQAQLGDIVFVELPAIGRAFKQGEEAAVVESVKAASDIYAPISGEVSAVNSALNDDPALVNQDAQGAGWFFKLKISEVAELDSLLDESAYQALIGESD